MILARAIEKAKNDLRMPDLQLSLPYGTADGDSYRRHCGAIREQVLESTPPSPTATTEDGGMGRFIDALARTQGDCRANVYNLNHLSHRGAISDDGSWWLFLTEKGFYVAAFDLDRDSMLLRYRSSDCSAALSLPTFGRDRNTSEGATTNTLAIAKTNVGTLFLEEGTVHGLLGPQGDTPYDVRLDRELGWRPAGEQDEAEQSIGFIGVFDPDTPSDRRDGPLGSWSASCVWRFSR